jgi:DNA/RNA endonuclease YhcR with UshA esterase domain
MNIRSIALFVLLASVGLTGFNVASAGESPATIASINQNKAKLAGKTVKATGKVVKVNNGIMGRNFLHIQDGSGDATTGDLTITSQQTAKLGDQISISGVAAVNRDFGSGYLYPLLIEDATITAK